MRDMIKMVVVLTVLSSLSGGLLAAIKNSTEDRIEGQVLQFVQGPAILKIMEGASNDPISDRFTITAGDEQTNFFVGKYNGTPKVVAFETNAAGYGGPVGIMVAFDVETNKIKSIGVTTHNETPGVGSLVEKDENFKKQFVGLDVTFEPKVNKDGGSIIAMSGATVTSRAVTAAVRKAQVFYEQHQSEIKDKAKSFTG